MKNLSRFSSCSRSGFTLVELLVVIAIIAILAAVVTAGASGAINAAKRAKAGNAATQIQTAILAYYTEYGVYPVPSGQAVDLSYSYNDNTQFNLMNALCGNINAYTTNPANGTITNTRQIAFLTPKRSDVDMLGIMINPFFNTANPSYFNIVIDSDYSGVVGDTSAIKLPDFSSTGWPTGQTSSKTLTGASQGVAIWADCDSTSLPPNQAASKAPQFWIRTY